MKKSKIVIRWLAGGTAVILLGVGSYHLCKYKFFKAAPKKSTVDATTDFKGNIDKKDFEKLVSDYMNNNPTVDEKSARYYLAHLYRESLGAELLYELAGIYDCTETTEKKDESTKSTTDFKGNIDKKDFEKLVSDYMNNNPTVDEKSARYYLAHLYQENLGAELFYELVDIYDCTEITEEKLEKKDESTKSATDSAATEPKRNIDKKDFEKLVSDYMANNPSVDEKNVKYELASFYQDSLDAELLYELTGIYDYAEITEEAFEKLVQSLYKNLKNKELNVNCDDVRKLVAIINSDQLATDMPKFLTKLMGNQTSSEFLTDALKITSTIKTYNHKKYNLDHDDVGMLEDLIIIISPYIYDLKSKSDLNLIEDYVLRLHKVKGNAVAQNEIVAQLLKDLYDYDGALTNIESGIGLASTVAVDSMINYVSFNEKGVCLLKEVNRDGLLVYNRLELYISNIYANLEKCNSKKLTK